MDCISLFDVSLTLVRPLSIIFATDAGSTKCDVLSIDSFQILKVPSNFISADRKENLSMI